MSAFGAVNCSTCLNFIGVRFFVWDEHLKPVANGTCRACMADALVLHRSRDPGSLDLFPFDEPTPTGDLA